MSQRKNHLIKTELCHFDVKMRTAFGSKLDPSSGCQRLRKPPNRQPENVWESRISAFKLCWHWEAPTALPSKLGLAVSISAVAQVRQEFERWILVKLTIRLYSLCRSNAQVYRYAFIHHLSWMWNRDSWNRLCGISQEVTVCHVSGGPCTWCSNWFAEV